MEIQDKNWDEFWELAEKQNDGFVLASLTDEYIVDGWTEQTDFSTLKENIENKKNKVLEIRVFNQEQELKLFRTDIGQVFHKRTINDTNLSKDDYIEEQQYLDIDTKRSAALFKEEHKVRATGGGVYHLPPQIKQIEDVRLKVRYYFQKDEETGVASIRDWRAVEFLCEGGE